MSNSRQDSITRIRFNTPKKKKKSHMKCIKQLQSNQGHEDDHCILTVRTL